MIISAFSNTLELMTNIYIYIYIYIYNITITIYAYLCLYVIFGEIKILKVTT